MAEHASIFEATTAVAAALGDMHYAIVGGTACALLGSVRETFDIDLVVVRGGTAAARARLQNSLQFRIEPRTRHTYYHRVPIEILAPPALFKGDFTAETPTIKINGAKVLKPTLLFNTKCGSICERGNDRGKLKDAEDIKFLLEWLIGEGCRMSPDTQDREEVPNVTKGFVAEFVTQYGGQSLWDQVFGRM